ncbi:hypothetical protein BS78_02G263300 [Paspalum vaginatum]|nr:hypothetical protein BS78_02G263300 [Paspalum vaginatum]
MVLRNASSTSAEEPLLRRHMAVILPSLMKPNSSWDIRRSSAKTGVPRYASGTSNRLPSQVYITQWPLTATEAQRSSTSFAIPQVSRFLPSSAILCHFLAI